METSTVLAELDARLDSQDGSEVVSAAWWAFDLTDRVALAIPWEEGNDELQAMLASQAAAEGRDRLPLPSSGEPAEIGPLASGASALAPYVALMQQTRAALDRIGDQGLVDPDSLESLRSAADCAHRAAQHLTWSREQ